MKFLGHTTYYNIQSRKFNQSKLKYQYIPMLSFPLVKKITKRNWKNWGWEDYFLFFFQAPPLMEKAWKSRDTQLLLLATDRLRARANSAVTAWTNERTAGSEAPTSINTRCFHFSRLRANLAATHVCARARTFTKTQTPRRVFACYSSLCE